MSSNSDIEKEIREATNTDPWGPSSAQSLSICKYVIESVVYGGAVDESRYLSSFEYYDNDDDDLNDLDSSDTDESEGSELRTLQGKVIVDYLFKRILRYSNNSQANDSKNESILKKIKKNYITYGLEYRILGKCLSLVFYLLINCCIKQKDGTIYDVKVEISDKRQVLEHLQQDYCCTNSDDNKSVEHTTVIKHQARKLVQLLDNDRLLYKERLRLNRLVGKDEIPRYLKEGLPRTQEPSTPIEASHNSASKPFQSNDEQLISFD